MPHSSFLFWEFRSGLGGEVERKETWKRDRVWGPGPGRREKDEGVFGERENGLERVERRPQVVRKIESFIRRVEKQEEKVRPRPKSHEYSEKVEKSRKLEEEVRASECKSRGELETMVKEKKGPRKWKKRDEETGRVKEEDDKFPGELLVRMEKRKEERAIRRKAMEDRRRKREMETKSELERKEKEKKEEKRKSIREEKERMEGERKKALRQYKLASEHCIRCLLLKVLRKWRVILDVRKGQSVAADDFDNMRVLKRFFRKWKEETKKRRECREEGAKLLYEKYLKRHVFGLWKAVCLERKSQVQAASDWHELKTVEKHLKLWMAFALEEHLRYLNLKEIADSAFEKKLKAKFLKRLRIYPKIKRIEINGIVRKVEWQRKIQEILPDYQPTCSVLELG